MGVVNKLGEGNIGAISVLFKMLNAGFKKDMSKEEIEEKTFSNIMTLLNFDDMNMRGSQIWLACKDACNIDIDKVDFSVDNKDNEENQKFLDFIEKVKDRDEDFIEIVNDLALKHHLPHKAVSSGASFIIAGGKDASGLYFTDDEKKDFDNIKENIPLLDSPDENLSPIDKQIIIKNADEEQSKTAKPSKVENFFKKLKGAIKNRRTVEKDDDENDDEKK